MKIGDILSSVWGYEQTNVDFYEVVKVNPKTVELCKIARKSEPREYMQYDVLPVPGKYIGKKFRRSVMTIPQTGEKYCKITSYAYAHIWDKQPMHCTSYA